MEKRKPDDIDKEKKEEEYTPKKQKTERVNISVIGSAGRKEDQHKVCIEHFQAMVKNTEDVIEKTWGLSWNQVTLVSGGAAFASKYTKDHVVVALYLKHKDDGVLLNLELPCSWDSSKGQYQECRTGKVSNFWHFKFKQSTGVPSLRELNTAINQGAQVTFSNGFFDRNAKVAQSERMISYTYNKTEPKSGGTGHTWKISKSKVKMHFCIQDLLQKE